MAFVHLFLIIGLATSASCIEETNNVIERLALRLEATEREYKREISAMKEKMAVMEDNFLKKEKEMLQKINELGEKFERNDDVIDSEQNSESEALKQRRSFKEVRDAVETEVAFYATHSKHDVTHLGDNQIIAFNQTVTNIGNAYNVHHGAFTAPVDGTYVFHVTLMGTLHDAANKFYSAFIDVDDIAYSRFWIVPYDQSSHMFVIELKSGNVVSVKNARVDDGIVGQHYSSFSGFLLYQHSYAPAIFGK